LEVECCVEICDGYRRNEPQVPIANILINPSAVDGSAAMLRCESRLLLDLYIPRFFKTIRDVSYFTVRNYIDSNYNETLELAFYSILLVRACTAIILSSSRCRKFKRKVWQFSQIISTDCLLLSRP
jgi:hypothetical protein